MNDVTFAKALQSVILDNKYDRFVKNRRTGKLDTRGLYRINTSSRLFKRREARKNKHYAITLVVDVSGSMGGNGKIQMAAESARKLSWHLSKMEIPHNIITFNAFIQEIKPFNKEFDPEIEDKILGELGWGPTSGDKHLKYGLWSANEHVQLKTLDGKNLGKGYKFIEKVEGWEKMAIRRKELDPHGHGLVHVMDGPGHNSDAEALKFAREQILKKEGRKMMVFLSDGQPAPLHRHLQSPHNPDHPEDVYDVKHEAEKTIAAGVELYSIGIMDDSVKRYYPPRRTAAINDINQLYPHIIKLIRLNLKRG